MQDHQSITVLPNSSCLTGLDLAKQVNLLFIQNKQKQLNPTNKNKVIHRVRLPLTKKVSALLKDPVIRSFMHVGTQWPDR